MSTSNPLHVYLKSPCFHRLRQAMELRGLRQADLVERSGFPKSAICQYLSGKIEPRIDRIRRLAEILEVSETWLLGYPVPMEADGGAVQDEGTEGRLPPCPMLELPSDSPLLNNPIFNMELRRRQINTTPLRDLRPPVEKDAPDTCPASAYTTAYSAIPIVFGSRAGSISENPNYRSVPILRRVQTGAPLYSEQNIEGFTCAYLPNAIEHAARAAEPVFYEPDLEDLAPGVSPGAGNDVYTFADQPLKLANRPGLESTHDDSLSDDLISNVGVSGGSIPPVEFFAFRVADDALSGLRIQAGDLVYIQRCGSVNNGDVALVLLEGQPLAFLTRYYRRGGVVVLMPQSNDPSHHPRVCDPQKTPLHILGKVVKVEFSMQ